MYRTELLSLTGLTRILAQNTRAEIPSEFTLKLGAYSTTQDYFRSLKRIGCVLDPYRVPTMLEKIPISPTPSSVVVNAVQDNSFGLSGKPLHTDIVSAFASLKRGYCPPEVAMAFPFILRRTNTIGSFKILMEPLTPDATSGVYFILEVSLDKEGRLRIDDWLATEGDRTYVNGHFFLCTYI